MNAVLFDDHCPMCTFQVRLLAWMDWFHVTRLQPNSEAAALTLAPGLTPEALQAAIHVVTPAGRVYRGARALRFLGMRIPLLVLPTLLLWIPGMIQLAEWVYQRVSTNRLVLSRLFGCREACAVLPARKREGDA